MSTASITKILARLTKVWERQPDQYSAFCPMGAVVSLEPNDGQLILDRKAAPEKEAA